MLKVKPFIWYDNEAEEAARFYVSIFPNSVLGRISRYPAAMAGREGTVMMVEFTLDGLPVTALNAGPDYPFDPAFSFEVTTSDQAETDHYWNALLAGGGSEQPCGWLKDRFGFYWQVVPEVLTRLVTGPDPAQANRAMAAMFKMKKIIVADIEAAAT
jgi:predicted 3-demethylubiquinone-9 3-methyltransferase (glyoxalase superfamily)